ncbi:hypothetical protein CBR_g6617 [Chara braunii]|uniref:Uncharacterized protein n=1 Tax=Chara braunii TaxID=69332 RepID=A0A388KKG9_CHABU|nr:hypothetical protein CBR_g6617 [Chara braunii]|eukprot:GBG70488.1 hypothetical protein CBR_g6617 [Chara braunii]
MCGEERSVVQRGAVRPCCPPMKRMGSRCLCDDTDLLCAASDGPSDIVSDTACDRPSTPRLFGELLGYRFFPL